jgi:hypothetical protein
VNVSVGGVLVKVWASVLFLLNIMIDMSHVCSRKKRWLEKSTKKFNFNTNKFGQQYNSKSMQGS